MKGQHNGGHERNSAGHGKMGHAANEKNRNVRGRFRKNKKQSTERKIKQKIEKQIAQEAAASSEMVQEGNLQKEPMAKVQKEKVTAQKTAAQKNGTSKAGATKAGMQKSGSQKSRMMKRRVQRAGVTKSDIQSAESKKAKLEPIELKPIEIKAVETQKAKTPKAIIGRNGRKISSKLKIIPLGGLEQIGMNITAFEYENSIVVVDCGLSFPEDDMLGIDLVIPDVTYLKDNIEKVKGFVITHGHEDHIGALPYVLKEINVPIYSTKLTLGLITNKLREHNLVHSTKLKEVKHGQVINLGDFSIEFIKTNHSIQDASALAIYSPAGIVVHTGDFKVDYTPVFGDVIDLQRFAEIC